MNTQSTPKLCVAYEPHRLGHSLAQRLWEKGVPSRRQVSSASEAHVVLYDEVATAVRGFEEDSRIMRIVVINPEFASTAISRIPRGVYWIKPDVGEFTRLIRTLNPGGGT